MGKYNRMLFCWSYSFFTILCLSSSVLAQQPVPKKSASPVPSPFTKDWALVAQSEIIVHGRLTDATVKQTIPGYGQTYQLSIAPLLTIKGSPVSDRTTFDFTEFSFDKGIIGETGIKRLIGKGITIFGVLQRGEKHKDIPIALAIVPLKNVNSSITVLRSEVENQRRIVMSNKDFSVFSPDKWDASVREQVERLLVKDEQASAIEQLINMGNKAVPSLIRQMNDRRPLPPGNVQLKTDRATNPSVPRPLEEYATYSPKLVFDLINIIVDRVTGQSFGSVYNGGSEDERSQIRAGWCIYLYYHRLPNTK